MSNSKTILAFHYFFILVYLEVIYKIFIFGFTEIFLWETLIMMLFLAAIACFLSMIGKIMPAKGNFIMLCSIIFLLCFWYAVNLVFVKIFNTYFAVSFISLTDQITGNLGKTTVGKIIASSLEIILIFLPFIYTMFLRFKLDIDRDTIGRFFKMLLVTVFVGALAYGSIYFTRDKIQMYDLFYKVDNNALNHEKGGVLIASYIDIKRLIFGFDEKIIVPDKPNDKPIVEIIYEPNILDIDFDSIPTTNNSLIAMNEYFKNDSGTMQNKYTGMFKGKNLIFITAESFNQIAVSESLTPTLYKLVNEGFVFENFYTPVNLSTIGGEFQVLTSQFAHQNVINEKWKKATITTPYGISNLFEESGYKTYAFHNGEYYFQGRDKYLKKLGFDNYLGCGNGMQKLINCNPWPRSDIEMIEKTTSHYLLEDKSNFMTYYMTNSGHFPYETSGVMYRKYKDTVLDLSYTNRVKAYLASQIELDKALEILINNLTLANQLDNTVIVLVADHYPYDLSLSEINELSTYVRDDKIEINRSNLIIWNNQIPVTKISKVVNQIDVMPTVYNLFGLSYDSRLFSGKDALSTEPGLVFFSNRSWVSDLGTYNAQTGIFKAKDGVKIPDNYIKNINATVANRTNMSKLIVEQDYYKYLGGN